MFELLKDDKVFLTIGRMTLVSPGGNSTYWGRAVFDKNNGFGVSNVEIIYNTSQATSDRVIKIL